MQRRRDAGNRACEVWSSAFTRRGGRNAVLGRLKPELPTETNPAWGLGGADKIVWLTHKTADRRFHALRDLRPAGAIIGC